MPLLACLPAGGRCCFSQCATIVINHITQQGFCKLPLLKSLKMWRQQYNSHGVATNQQQCSHYECFDPDSERERCASERPPSEWINDEREWMNVLLRLRKRSSNTESWLAAFRYSANSRTLPTNRGRVRACSHVTWTKHRVHEWNMYDSGPFMQCGSGHVERDFRVSRW